MIGNFGLKEIQCPVEFGLGASTCERLSSSTEYYAPNGLIWSGAFPHGGKEHGAEIQGLLFARSRSLCSYL